MQRLVASLLRRVRQPPASGSDAGPCAAGTPEVREKRRGGLHGAAASGDLARLQRHWWRKRLRINWRDAEKQTPLHLACVNGHADVVRFLARKKCQLNPRDNFKKSPLMKAVEQQHKDCVAILLEHGANPNLKDASGNTALHLAAITSSKSLVELLLEHNAHIEAQNELGYTPLTVAIAECCEEMVEFLLQKGADVHAQDKNKRTTLMVAALAGDMNVIRILLRYGADLSQEDLSGCTALHYARVSRHADICEQLEEYMACEMRGECSAEGTKGPAVLDSSCSGKTADSPLGTPALTGAGVLSAAGAQEEEVDDSPFDSESDCEAPTKAPAGVLLPAADGKEARAQPIAGEIGNGVLSAAGAQEEEDDDSPFDSESDCEAPTKPSAFLRHPPAYRRVAWVQPIAGEIGNGVLSAAGAQEEEVDDSPFDSESDCEAPTKAPAGVLLPAADGKGARAQPIAGEIGNGVLSAAGAQEEEVDDSPFDSESDCEAPTKAPAGVLLPAADGKGARAQPIAGEIGNGVLSAAGAQEEEVDDSPFDSESDCEAPTKAPAGVLLPAADGKGARAQPIAGEIGNGVLSAAGAQEEEVDDSPFDSESDCEAPTKAPAGVLLPAADGKGARAQPIAGEIGNGVLSAAGAQEEEVDDSPFDSESDCEAPTKAPAGVLLPAADGKEARAQPIAGEIGNGVLSAAGAQEEEVDDSPFDSESDCEAPTKAPAGVLLPAADGKGARAQPIAGEIGNGVLSAAGAQEEEVDDSPFDSESDCEAPTKAPAGVLLPAADGKGARAQPIAGEIGNGVLSAAGAQEEEDDDSPFDSESDCEAPTKPSAFLRHPPAYRRVAWVQPIAGEIGNGVLSAAGAQEEEVDDSPFDSESDCEAPTKAPAGVLLPAADGKGARAQPIAGEIGNGVLSAAGAQEEEVDDSPFDSESDCEAPTKAPAGVLLPAADGKGARAQPIAGEIGNGVLSAAGAQEEEVDDSPFDSESDCEAPTKAPAGVLLPAADGKGARAQPIAGEIGNGVLSAAGAQEEEVDDSPFDSESDCEAPTKAPAGVLLPAADGKGARAQPIAGEIGNGVLSAAGAQEEEVDDSPFDSESDCEAPTKAPAGVLLPAADGKEARAQPIAGEIGNGVLSAAGAQEEEVDDSPFDSESDCEAPTKAPAGVLLPAADGKGARAQPIAGEIGNGVLSAAGAQEEEVDDSPFDSESDCEAPTKAPAGVLLPAADGKGARAQPIAGEIGNGVLSAAGAQEEEVDDSPFDSESDCEAPTKAPAGVLLPAADGKGARAQPIAGEIGNGVLSAAGAQEEEVDDSPFDSESDCEAPTKPSAFLRHPPAYRRVAWVQPIAGEIGNGVLPAAGAQEVGGFHSAENKVSALDRKELQLKKDASCQADFQGDRQRWVKQLQQELANTLKRNSLTDASPEAMKSHSRYLQDQKLQLQKELDRSKAQLQQLKERHIRTECYAESLKNAIKKKERELTTSRNLQDLLTTSFGTAAIPDLEERMQRLQGEKARLEATVQQQAKTIEALQKNLQASASSHNGLEDLVTGFQTTRTAKEHQRWQRGSESKEVKKLAKMKSRSEALLDEVRKRNATLEEEQTRLEMLLQISSTILTAHVARKRKSQLSFRGEMKKAVPN